MNSLIYIFISAFISAVIGTVIGWSIQSFGVKGRFTRLNINDDGSVWLLFECKKRFGKFDWRKQTELDDYLKKYFKGLKEVTVVRNELNEMSISMTLEKKKDEQFILPLEEQEKYLNNLCKNC